MEEEGPQDAMREAIVDDFPGCIVLGMVHALLSGCQAGSSCPSDDPDHEGRQQLHHRRRLDPGRQCIELLTGLEGGHGLIKLDFGTDDGDRNDDDSDDDVGVSQASILANDPGLYSH